jgi:hypothetical protein
VFAKVTIEYLFDNADVAFSDSAQGAEQCEYVAVGDTPL